MTITITLDNDDVHQAVKEYIIRKGISVDRIQLSNSCSAVGYQFDKSAESESWPKRIGSVYD